MAASNGPSHGRAGGSSNDRDPAGADPKPLLLNSLATDASPETLRAGAFWSAVVLPFLHVPLLASGLATTGQQQAFLVLLVANVVAVYAGHGYGTD